MSKMNLIMERWETYVNEELDACPQQVVDIDTFMTALELATMDKEAQTAEIEKLKASRANIDKLNKVLEITGFLGAIPGVAASGGIALGAAFVAIVANAWRSRQEKQTDKKIHQLLSLLCIDQALLDTIDNDIEQAYWANSGIQAEVEQLISSARANPQPDPMPDFTKHLVKWLNKDPASPYATTGTKGADTDIVVR